MKLGDRALRIPAGSAVLAERRLMRQGKLGKMKAGTIGA